MSRENKTDAAAERRTEYAFWAIPGSGSTVTYSLPLFHEIDFAVNEGYRKIPHGGIEEGGLLFGTIDAKGTKIEAYRPIVCEHASGPSFLLSDHDLEVLATQIEQSISDPDLEGLQLVGWFLAHTRGPLTLTDREVILCNQLFPKPGMVTVLVKPERFQPTRFGFLVRGSKGSLERDASANAIILPLPGRGSKNAQGPIASIPAPAASPTTVAKVRAAEAEEAEDPPPPQRKPAPRPEIESEEIPPAAAARQSDQRPTNRRPPRLKVDRVLQPDAEDQELDAHEGDRLPVGNSTSLTPAGARDTVLPRRNREIAQVPDHALLHDDDELVDVMPDPYRQVEMLNQKRPMSSTARFVLVLPLAALLGCLVGYLAYLQVPPALFSLAVSARGENLIVTWPAEQTRNASYAAVRVDDSAPVPLTPEEKQSGRVEVQARPDMKVEVIARNFFHNSVAIVHYVKPVANTAP